MLKKNLLIFYVVIQVKEEGWGYTNAFICIGTHSQLLLQNRLKDVYETW